MGEDLPALRTATATDALGVDRDHDALFAEFLGRFLDEFAPGDRGAVDRHLVGPEAQQCLDVVDGADPAANRQRHETGLCRPPHHVQHGAAVFMGRRDIEKAKFVGTGGVIGNRRLHGITGVAQVDEVDTLDDPAVLDVETGDDADLEHSAGLLRLRRPRRGSMPAPWRDRAGRHRGHGRRSPPQASRRAARAWP